MNEAFRKLAQRISKVAGSAWTFILAISLILIWLLSGPLFNYSDTWQLMVNTTTTIITFLMVFLIQNTQNRDSKAQHLKLDELLRAVKGARLSMLDAEDLPDEKLEMIHQEFKIINEKHNGQATNKKTKKQRHRDMGQQEPTL
ncbi:MAG: low affinity iron permease family protein [Patescibacteria group bacterium]